MSAFTRTAGRARVEQLEDLYDRLLDGRCEPKWNGSGDQITSRCPNKAAHKNGDQNSSFSAGLSDDGKAVLTYCHRGCSFPDICQALDVPRSYFRIGQSMNGHQNGATNDSADNGHKREPERLPDDDALHEAQRSFAGSVMAERMRVERGWSPMTMLLYGLGYADGRIWIPYPSTGELVNLERYDPDSTGAIKTLPVHGRKRHVLLPPGGISGEEVIITEGAPDAIAAHSRGLTNVAAAPSATIWKPEYVDPLVSAGVKRLIVVGDCDGSGRDFNRRVGKSFKHTGVSVHLVDLDSARNDGYDLTDWLQEHRDLTADQIASELDRLSVPYLSADDSQSSKDFELVAPSLDDVRPIEWAWQDRIVMGLFNLLVGNEGAGKGTLAAWLLAQITRGELPGDLYGTPAGVVIVGDEDDLGRTWTPRLHVAGADLAKVRKLSGPQGATLTFPSGIDRLRQLLVEFKPRVVFSDQLLDNLDAGINPNATQDVRRAVMPLRLLAGELGMAFIGTLHTNKTRGGNFRQSVSNSHQFNAISKSSLLIAEHPDGPEERRVVARGKGNYGRRPVSQEFTIQDRSPKIGDHKIPTSVAVDFKDSPLTANELLAPQKTEQTSKASRVREALEEILADHEWHDSGPIISDLTARFEVGARAVRKAREDIVAITEPKSEFQGGHAWRLPAPHETFSRNGHLGHDGDTAIPAKVAKAASGHLTTKSSGMDQPTNAHAGSDGGAEPTGVDIPRFKQPA